MRFGAGLGKALACQRVADVQRVGRCRRRPGSDSFPVSGFSRGTDNEDYAEGLVSDDHIAGEMGEVRTGRTEGRRDPQEVTIYKSLGHIAQDLAAVRYALQRAFAGSD